VPSRRNIPKPAVRRLSLYLRELTSRQEAGEETVSSKSLGRSLGLTDAQVRKDLALFGQFGHPGRGYAVPDLVASLRRIMGRDRLWRACVVGAGNIGRALLAYPRFAEEGFELVAVFDRDAGVVGRKVAGHAVQSMAALVEGVRRSGAQLGIVAGPPDQAQDVADRLVEAGVRGVLNFAPRPLRLLPGVAVVAVDFTEALERLAFETSLRRQGSQRQKGA